MRRSHLRKIKRMDPPSVLRSDKNGNVVKVHVVGEISPTFDPLVDFHDAKRRSLNASLPNDDSLRSLTDT